MSLYDNLRVKRSLPRAGFEDPRVVEEIDFQTKDTPVQYLELYELREDGTLWFCEVEREWRPGGVLGMHSVPVSEQWVFQEQFTGEIQFYSDYPPSGYENPMATFSAYFVRGQLKELHDVTADKQVNAST